METEHMPNKHLTYEERDFIEIGLKQGRNFTEIAKDLNKDRRTISREVQKHRFRRNPSGDSIIQRTYAKADMNVRNLIALMKKNVTKKRFVLHLQEHHMYVMDVNKRIDAEK